MEELVTLKVGKELFDKLFSLAKRELYTDVEGWYPDDSGNFDDAYQCGVQDGESILAAELLQDAGYKI